MPPNASSQVLSFLTDYDAQVAEQALKLRDLVLTTLPQISEQVDLPAKMIMYVYGPKYADLICNIIPSKKGLKLGFNRGTQLNDSNRLLQGSGKISRYVVIDIKAPIPNENLSELLHDALKLYQEIK